MNVQFSPESSIVIMLHQICRSSPVDYGHSKVNGAYEYYASNYTINDFGNN